MVNFLNIIFIFLNSKIRNITCIEFEIITVLSFFSFLMINGEACPRGSFGYDCIRTCSSEYFGQNCNEKCNCSSNQRCHPVFGCLEKNVITERLSVQHLTETPNFSGSMISIWYVIYALNLYNVYHLIVLYSRNQDHLKRYQYIEMFDIYFIKR